MYQFEILYVNQSNKYLFHILNLTYYWIKSQSICVCRIHHLRSELSGAHLYLIMLIDKIDNISWNIKLKQISTLWDHTLIVHLFISLFVWGFPSHSRFFHLFGRVTITGEGWQTTSFDLYSALMAIEQWGFFNVPHLLWHKPSLYQGHLQGPVTITFVAERLALELSRPVLTTLLCPNWNRTLISHMLGERSTTKPLWQFQGYGIRHLV